MRVRNVNRAFTLIEILIVVVILGILAAIVIPQFTDASEQAQEASVRSQLQTIRGQLELHNVQQPPSDIYDSGTALATFWNALVDLDYLQSPPRNPIMDSMDVAAAPAAGVGWVWGEKQGASTTYTLYAVGFDPADGTTVSYFDEDGDGVITDEGPAGVPN